MLAVAALVLLGGCSNGVQASPPSPRPFGPENPTRPATPEAWLDQVCTALLPAVRTATPVPAIDLNDPYRSREATVAFLTTRADAFTNAADGINDAGPAPGEAGQDTT